MKKIIHLMLMVIFTVTLLGVIVPPLISGGTVELIVGVITTFVYVVIFLYWKDKVFYNR